MSKRFRQGQILKLIRESSPSIRRMKSRRSWGSAAFRLRRSRLSRDLRELGLVKTQDGYREMSREEPADDLAGFSANMSVTFGRRAEPASAEDRSRTCESRRCGPDSQDWPEVVGTVAGDDTVLIVTADDAERPKLFAASCSNS